MTTADNDQNAHPELPDPTDLPIFERRHLGSSSHKLSAGGNKHKPSQTPDETTTDPAPEPHPFVLPGITPRSIQQRSSQDWRLVKRLRAETASRLTAQINEQETDPAVTEEIGRAIIQDILASEVAEQMHSGQVAWTTEEQMALARAVFDAMFRMGRLQPLIDDDTVENIIVSGYESVWVDHTDGSLEQMEPVADSDEELLDFLAFVASRVGRGRPFSQTHPTLHLRLPSGDRLAAAAWITSRPSVVIRRHRMRQVSLNDLVQRNMISDLQASFLHAAVRAGKNIVVAGPQGGGKTTLVRALCASIPATESIGTFETEYELMLDELREQHPIVHAFEARPGSGEMGPDGRRAGEYTIDDAIYDSFRFFLSRQIVGEVRGREVWAMIKAMESGSGSISTTHSSNADAAFRKLVTCAMETGPHVTQYLATSKLSETVDLLVQVSMISEPHADNPNRYTRQRWVSEILAVGPGEPPRGYSTTPIFRPNPAGGPALPGTLPSDYRDLARQGFDLAGYMLQGHLANEDL